MFSPDNECKISIIIPFYNSSAYLPRTIQCLQAQFFRSFEMIFVDDGSTDDSADLIQQYMKDDCRIRLIRNDIHQNAGICRNCGLNAAAGEYVIFLDADDYFYPNLLEATYSKAKEQDADVVVFGREVVDMTTSPNEYGIPAIKYDIYNSRVIYGGHATTTDYGQGAFIPWNKLVRKQFILDHNIRFQDLPSNNDIYYSFSVITVAEKIVYLSQVLIRYFKSLPSSLTAGRTKKNYLPEALANCIAFTQRQAYPSEKAKTVNEYLLKIIKRELISGESSEICDKTERFTRFQNAKDWIDNCINDNLFNTNDLIFLDRLKYNQIENETDLQRLELLPLISLVNKTHKSHQKIALWGCGIRGQKWLKIIEHNKIDIDYVIDENPKLQGTVLNGFTIHSYREVKNEINVILLMIANPSIIAEIKKTAHDKIILEEGDWNKNA